MKNLIYNIYALFFNISAKLFGIKQNRVALVSMHNENFNDSLGGIYDEMRKSGKYQFVFISRQDLEVKLKNVPRVFSFFLVKSRALATSKYVFLNDNFLPMAKLNFSKDAVITQLWHGEGVFKKFGFAITQSDEVRKNEAAANKKLSFVVCSSKNVAPYYAQAFGVDKKQVLPLGSPRTDYFFAAENAKVSRAAIDKAYPQLQGKKLILYAPTFRDNFADNKTILSHFDADRIQSALGEDYAVLIRLHPQVHTFASGIGSAVNVTDFCDVRQLVLACSVLITDYSSICMDFSLLDKKTIFFAYDKQSYTGLRDFYFDYETYVPGKVVYDMQGVIEAIKEPFDRERNEKFKKFNFDFADNLNARRIIDAVTE